MNALITGASSGIGEAIADLFSQSNINLFLTGRDEEKLTKVAEKCLVRGVKVYLETGDVKKFSDCQKIYTNSRDKFSQIDILVASAGVGHFDSFENLTGEQFDDTFNVNVRGVFNYVKLVLPDMKKRNSGQIIIISSVSAFETYKRGGLYCASKYAVQAMAETLRKELKETKIKVGTVNPGSVDTPWFDKRANFDNNKRKTMLKAIDVAKATKFLVDQPETANVDKIVLEY